MADDQRQLDLEGCARAGVGRQVLEVLLRTIATLAFGYAGETGVLEARIGFIFGMGDWFCILKEICMCEAGGVAGECSQAFKEASARRRRRAAVHYRYMREYLVQVHE